MSNLNSHNVTAHSVLLKAKKDPNWPKLTKNKTGRFKYADLPHIIELFTTFLAGFDLIITFEPIVDRNTNAEIMRTVLTHTPTNDKIVAESLLKTGDSDTKLGSSHTYQKRYGAFAVLGISADEIDPDELINAEDIEKIKAAIKANPYAKDGTACNKIFKALLSQGKLEKIEQLKYEHLDAALDFINQWKE